MSASTSSDTYQPKTSLGRVTNFVDTRVGGSSIVKEFGRKIFPDHWSFMFGEVALYTFVILLLSGTFLTLFFDPSMAETHYEGSYVPLKGVEMSVAYASTLDISFDIRGGLFMRQLHHWSALLFVASVSVHMLRVFFTGAFRRPRELNWLWQLASPVTPCRMTCSPATACASSMELSRRFRLSVLTCPC
jgi:ubiquinol-cytochrome c reductase cytochrome b subunit